MSYLQRFARVTVIAALGCTLLMAGGAMAAEVSADACNDPLVKSRREAVRAFSEKNRRTPWPIDLFQPQAVVRGATRPVPLGAAVPKGVKSGALDAARAVVAVAPESKALLVTRNGNLELAWFAEGVTEQTLHHTYHLHHAPLAVLVGIAVDEGKIASIDAPASTYITEWKGTPKEKITIRHLLQMRSGLDVRVDADYAKGLYTRDACAYWGGRTKDIIIAQYPLVEPPDATFTYNYIVPELLGVILQRATGERYEDYLSSRLWQPLGNRDARVWLNREGGEAHQDAALFASAVDWLRLGELLAARGELRGRRIVSTRWIAEMTTPHPKKPNYGFLWLGSPHAPSLGLSDVAKPYLGYTVFAKAPFALPDVIYASGYGGQRVYASPSTGLVVVHIAGLDRNFDNTALFNVIAAGLR